MKFCTVYLVIKATVEADDDALANNGCDTAVDVREKISSECDYNVTFDQNGMKIINTEIVGVSDTEPNTANDNEEFREEE